MPCTLCRHKKLDGLRCRAIALRQKDYCYFHLRYHLRLKGNRPISRRPTLLMQEESIEMQPPIDQESILRAMSQTVTAVTANTISRERAAVLLSGLGLAAKIAASLDETSGPDDPVLAINEKSPAGYSGTLV